jgi:hypothetical protein
MKDQTFLGSGTNPGHTLKSSLVFVFQDPESKSLESY